MCVTAVNQSLRALLIDMDGVLYQGEQAIPGAAETMEWLANQAIPYLFLTNTTSRPRSSLVDKLHRLGISTQEERILTPPVAASHWLKDHVLGPVALFVPPATVSEFEGIEIADLRSTAPVAAVVVGDYGDHWTYRLLNQAFRWLMEEPLSPLVALGMTRYWRSEEGLCLDTGPFVTALQHASGRRPVVLGKPAPPFFETALKQVGVDAAQACMIGDDIRGDVDGAQAVGIRGLLVKTGKFRPDDLSGEIKPAGVLDSFAGLPDWWQTQDR